jgi:hypothetical protein
LSAGSEETRGDAFSWVTALLIYATGAAILSLLGSFVGFAQALGVYAAWCGGCLAVSYGLMIVRGPGAAAPLGGTALLVSLYGLVSVSFMVGLFAPAIDSIAFAVLALGLLAPRATTRLSRLSPLLRPWVIGLLAAIPAAAAVLLALARHA